MNGFKAKLVIFLSLNLVLLGGPAPDFSEPLKLESGFVGTTAGKIFYRKFYADSSKTNTPLLVINGGPGYSHDHMLGIKWLGYARPIIFYDQMGTGKSDRLPKENWVLAYHLKELEELVAKLGLAAGKFNILGHSWGASIAIEYVLKHQDVLNKFILSGPLIDAPLWAEYTDKLAIDLAKSLGYNESDFSNPAIFEKIKSAFNKKYVLMISDLPKEIADSLNTSDARVLNKEIYEYMQGVSEFTITGTLKEWTRLADMPKIKVPTLFLIGEFDEVDPQFIKKVSDSMPNSRVQVLKDASHLTFIEQPGAYMAAINSFLDQQ